MSNSVEQVHKIFFTTVCHIAYSRAIDVWTMQLVAEIFFDGSLFTCGKLVVAIWKDLGALDFDAI